MAGEVHRPSGFENSSRKHRIGLGCRIVKKVGELNAHSRMGQVKDFWQ